MDTEVRVYIGPNESLKGEQALVRGAEVPGYVYAQFTRATTGLSHGWHAFGAKYFEPIPTQDD